MLNENLCIIAYIGVIFIDLINPLFRKRFEFAYSFNKTHEFRKHGNKTKNKLTLRVHY